MKKIALALASALVLAAGSADAATFVFTGQNSQGSVSGSFTTSDVDDVIGGHFYVQSVQIDHLTYSGSIMQPVYNPKTGQFSIVPTPYSINESNLTLSPLSYWQGYYNPVTTNFKGFRDGGAVEYVYLENNGFTLSFDDFNARAMVFVAPNNGSINFWENEVTISQLTSAVPEPATWTMMILGFGAVSAAVRRRRQAPLALA